MKYSARFLWLVLLFMTRSVMAASCLNIWPAATTGNSAVGPTLPVFTGSAPLTLNATLGSGDFHYSNTSLSGGTLTTSSVTTRLYFNGGLSLSGSAQLNPAGNPENLIIIVNGSVSLTGQSVVRGLIYATGSVSMAGQASVNGAVTAAGSVSTSGGSGVTYNPNAVANANVGSLCTLPPILKLVSPVCGSSNKAIVTFYSSGGRVPLGPSAENTANYSITGTAGFGSITSAILSDEGYEVQLTVSGTFTSGRTYGVAVSGVRDTNGVAMTAGNDSFYYASTQNGMVGSYWGNTTLSGGTSSQSVDSNIDFDWNIFTWPAGSFASGYSIRWEGYIEPATTGNYTFQSESRDGSRVWLDDINGSTIIDRWASSDGIQNSSTIALVAGQRYPLKVEFFKDGEAFATKQMHLRWQTPGSGSFAAVPNGNLRTCVSSFVSNTGLVAHYKLEGPTWNGSANEVRDTSYNRLHGTTINNPAAAPAAVCNGAVMNGTNYIRINDNPLLDLTNALSITAWIKLDSVGSELKSIFSKDTNYEFHINQNRRVFWWWNTNGGATRSFDTGASVITLGAWHHIGVVYSSTRQSIYIDGVERAFRTYANEILRTNNNPMEIGADQGLSNRIWVGSIDEVKLYDRALSAAEVNADRNATNPCANLLSRFEVTVPVSASVCAAAPVTIRAVMSNGSTHTGYTGTVNITTSASHGNWSKSVTANGTLNPALDSNDDGAVQYSFVAGDNGQAILNLANTHADQLRITATENAGSGTGTSGSVTFSENAFEITPQDALGTDFIAGRNHGVRVRVLKRDSPTTDCGVMTAYNGNFALKAWAASSGAVPAGIAPSLSTTTAPVQLPASQPGSNNATLAFVQGVANVNWITSDVGQHAFNLRDDSSGMVVNSSGQPLPIIGSSSNFTVRPFGLYVQAQNRRTPITTNPAASSATGAAFVKAGEDFDVTARGVQYQLADDADANGIPDVGANLSNNAVTPAFGTEGESVALSSALVQPVIGSGAVDPGLVGVPATAITSFGSGAGSATVRYNEVGILQINAALSDGNYLGGGRNVTGNIPYVGRFYPDRFLVTHNPVQLRDGSGSWNCDFTYQGQPFGFVIDPQLTITAVNLAGSPTVNYTDAFWSLATPQHTITLAAASVPAASACLNAGVVTSACFTENSAAVSRTLNGTALYDGIGTFVTGQHTLQINKLNTQPNGGDVPYTPRVDFAVPQSQLTVTESNGDTICYKPGGSCAAYTINTIGTEMRYGRVWIDNVTGPVMTPLVMPVRLQYWNAASQFVTNSADNDAGGCSGTPLQTTDIQLSGFTGNLASGETSVAAVSRQPGYYLMSLAAPGYSAANQPNDGNVDVTWLLDADASDNAPGEACTGKWLCYDYNGDGLNDNPGAKGIFSSLPDGRPVLFLKETYR